MEFGNIEILSVTVMFLSCCKSAVKASHVMETTDNSYTPCSSAKKQGTPFRAQITAAGE